MSRPGARGGTLVLGGGFAGVAVARGLGGRGATLVSPGPDLVFTPLLPEVAAGEVRLDHVSTPLRVVCPRAEIVEGTVCGVDLEQRVAVVETATGEELRL